METSLSVTHVGKVAKRISSVCRRAVVTAGIYARVSTADQNCDLQLDAMRPFAERWGWTIAEYVDQGVSGMKKSRPALDRLMADARLGKIDVVLVWKLDRFGRSLQNLMDSIFELDRLKIRFIAVTQGIDTDHSSPMGKFILHLFAAIAEFERGMIVERVKAGVTAAQKRVHIAAGLSAFSVETKHSICMLLE